MHMRSTKLSTRCEQKKWYYNTHSTPETGRFFLLRKPGTLTGLLQYSPNVFKLPEKPIM